MAEYTLSEATAAFIPAQQGGSTVIEGEAHRYELRLLDNLLEGCQIINREWRYTYLNDVAVDHGRRDRDELIGKTMMEAYPGIEDTEMFATLEHVMSERVDARIENEFSYPDGRTGWFELHVQPCDEGILILSKDITPHKLALQASENEVKRLDTLRHIDLAITSSTDLSVVLEIVLDRVVDSLNVDAASFLLFEEDSLLLRQHQQRGLPDQLEEHMSIKLGEGLAGRSALNRETLTIDDLRNDPHFLRRDAAPYAHFESYFATPLLAKGSLIGILELFHRTRKAYDGGWLNFFELISGQAAIAIDHIQTFGSLQRANMDLLLAYDHTIGGWAKTLELRDIETEGHSRRVRDLADELARRLGIKQEQLIHIRRGAMLHDIGKLGIPDAILLKEGELTDAEWEIMKKHPEIGYQLVSMIDFLAPALDIIRYHHERWDGAGYPRGLEGDLIPLSARIFAVVDVWDALRSDRPYRPPWEDEPALDHIRDQSGQHFDPSVVDAFEKMIGWGLQAPRPRTTRNSLPFPTNLKHTRCRTCTRGPQRGAKAEDHPELGLWPFALMYLTAGDSGRVAATGQRRTPARASHRPTRRATPPPTHLRRAARLSSRRAASRTKAEFCVRCGAASFI